MISILIPTYNYNAFPLASDIEKLIIKTTFKFEIICIDDGSKSALNIENKKINSLANGQFIASPTNVGLSINRNNLAKLAQYEFLLFIDSDSEIINDDFISNYIKEIVKNPDVIYGGRIHPEHVESERKLRWKYGKRREDTHYSKRLKNKYKSVLFNNTVIKKTVFNKIRFNNSITQYGHEDTIFAYNLSLINANIKHIDNNIMHGDVDLNHVFFNKMHKSLENLNYIYTQKIINPNFITFLQVFIKLKKNKMHYLFSWIHKIFYPFFKTNLTSNNPSLNIFNLFRLSYFCNINIKK
ncbi:MAG: glycosyltransferase family 2 protein [Algibacter sp.]